MEIWKPIKNYESIYEVSNLGRIKRIGEWFDGRKRRLSIRKLEVSCPNGTTYVRVGLTKNGKQKRFSVHRLAAQTFIGKPPSKKHQVNHKDGNGLNNSAENLEWCTSSENNFHRYRILHVPSRPGSKHHNAKITEEDVLVMRDYREQGYLLKELAKKFGVSIPTVCWIIKRKSWRHI